jgi:hypothetical protein
MEEIPRGKRFGIEPSDLLANSSEEMIDITGCKDMRHDAPEYSNADGTVVVRVRGSASADAPWTVSYRPLTYVQTDQEEAPPREVAVYASLPVEIDIAEPASTSTILHFAPLFGAEEIIQLGQDGQKLRFLTSNPVGEQRRYHYAFVRH